MNVLQPNELGIIHATNSQMNETNCGKGVDEDGWITTSKEANCTACARAVIKREQRERHERRKEEIAWIVRKRALALRVMDALDSDFLFADAVFAADPDAALGSSEEFDELKTFFVRCWATRELPQPLDDEQAAAVAATSGDVQVVARAGSGKTRTLVARAIFLQKHCGVSPREILLLAFNKNAAEEMKTRLAETLGEDLPHVMTFDALAYALVRPEESLVVDDASANQLGLSREVQEVIDEHVKSEEYGDRVRHLMLAHLRDDREPMVDGRLDSTMGESLAHRRALPRESLKGDYIKSRGEKIIANALFEHSVHYEYERSHRWDGDTYRPDFTIPIGSRGGVIVEYFGLEGDAAYDKMSQRKREFWTERDEWALVELSRKDLKKNGKDGFIQLLLQKIEEAGVSCRRRSEEEIWKLCRRRAVDSFTRSMKDLISRCSNRNLNPDDLESMVARHVPCSTAEATFLEVGVLIYRGYLRRLAADKKEDFPRLMRRSVSRVREGRTDFKRGKGRENGDLRGLRFVMIDEFQDFTNAFFELTEAIRSTNPSVQFFCVGDDWQAIYGFTGSDPRFFRDFAAYFRNTSRHHIRTNYRSRPSVIEVGNALMRGRGPLARSARYDVGWVQLCKIDEFEPSATELARHDGDTKTPAVLRLVRSFLDRGTDVVMLSRSNNGPPWYVKYGSFARNTSDKLARFLEHVHSHLPEEERKRVTASTVHKYKGQEKAAVIVLDAVEERYPLIHPNWVFFRVFGETIDRIEDEERRLFYVAVTRAKDSLALLTETSSQSPYLDDINRRVQLNDLRWEVLPPVLSQERAYLEIRISNAHQVRDRLKKLAYQWNPEERYWCKAVMAERFSFDALLRQPWAVNGVRIKVYSETGKLLHCR